MTDPERPFATVRWNGDLRFDAETPSGHHVLIDADSKQGPSPVLMLAAAAGACAGSDVVSILEKKRIRMARCDVEIRGRRPDEYPRPFTELTLRFHLAGEGLTETAARRSVELSVEKYCSVLLSLNPAIPVRTEIVIEA
ncbi:MAG: OsmC family protein [Gemmatimonadales bacterium]